MALKTVSDLKYSVSGLLSGLDLSNVDNLNGALERAARAVVAKANIPEASGVQNITLYSGVTDYPCDARIFGTEITDIRPQGVSRSINDYVYKRFPQTFDRTKDWLPNGTMATFEYINGSPIIRIVSTQTIQRINIDPMNDTDGWTAAGSASGLVQDTAVFYQSPASLRFTLTGSSSGTLTKTLSSSLDMSAYENVGVAFLAIEIPPGATATDLTSIALKLGSSALAYDSMSNTTGFLGAWTAGNWLLVAYDFSGAVSTGVPDWSAIDYVQVTLNHTATLTNFRVGGLWIALPNQAQILYESAAIFLASGTSSPSQTITLDTDTIMLADPAYSIYEYESAISILQQTGGSASTPTMQTFVQTLHGVRARNGSVIQLGLYDIYNGQNPSAVLRTVGSYYESNNSYYGRC